ncbi:MAG: hypothetical protein ACJ76H_01770 [Bacteriovoracaceae bacterium]
MTTEMTTDGLTDKNTGRISLETLSKMTGFPVEMIKDEIFQGKGTEDISLEDLRSAMLTYIDSTILMKDEK